MGSENTKSVKLYNSHELNNTKQITLVSSKNIKLGKYI